ncbi:hypothetical protein B0H19DRAFT_1074330 [Mycena capillaripes]|nr:hypothetical protein B0H19DRAFT_1074330 [Mycena capillaripes]
MSASVSGVGSRWSQWDVLARRARAGGVDVHAPCAREVEWQFPFEAIVLGRVSRNDFTERAVPVIGERHRGPGSTRTRCTPWARMTCALAAQRTVLSHALVMSDVLVHRHTLLTAAADVETGIAMARSTASGFCCGRCGGGLAATGVLERKHRRRIPVPILIGLDAERGWGSEAELDFNVPDEDADMAWPHEEDNGWRQS